MATIVVGKSGDKALSFERWYKALDTLLTDRYGFGVNDGADFPSYDTWDSGGDLEDGVEVWCEWQDMDLED